MAGLVGGLVSALDVGVVARRVLRERDERGVLKQRGLLEAARKVLPNYLEFIGKTVREAAGEGKLMCDVNLHPDEYENRVFHALLVWELFSLGFGVVDRRMVPKDGSRISPGETVRDALLVGVNISWSRVWDDPVPVCPVGAGGRVLDLPRAEGVVVSASVAPGMGEPPGMTQDDYPNGRSVPLPDVPGPDYTALT